MYSPAVENEIILSTIKKHGYYENAIKKTKPSNRNLD